MLNRLYGAGACGAFGLTTGQCLRVEIHGFNGWLKTMMLETCLSTHVGCSMRNLHANLQKKTGN